MRVKTLRESGRELVRSWASDLDDNARDQALRSARSSAVAGPIALMADAHWGLGATIGSVIPSESAIIPAAVGVDIGCGMIAVETSLRADQLPDSLKPLLSSLGRAIPAGFSQHKRPLRAAETWLAAHQPSELTAKQRTKSVHQLGSLGSGNHFVEVCADERDCVWGVLHSGSRGVGNQLAMGHITKAKDLCERLDRALEDKDLAYFLDSDREFGAYIDDMLWAQDYALKNRELMMDALLDQLQRAVGRPVDELQRINCHHNYTVRERHDGRELWITRKGAIRARPGDLGVIPGSMGTSSYIVEGLGNSASYESAAHGAGRRMGRKQARRELTADEFVKSMGDRVWQRGQADKLLDEAPMAYKDIETVMADQADLVQIRHELHALLNYKGT